MRPSSAQQQSNLVHSRSPPPVNDVDPPRSLLMLGNARHKTCYIAKCLNTLYSLYTKDAKKNLYAFGVPLFYNGAMNWKWGSKEEPDCSSKFCGLLSVVIATFATQEENERSGVVCYIGWVFRTTLNNDLPPSSALVALRSIRRKKRRDCERERENEREIYWSVYREREFGDKMESLREGSFDQ